MMVCISLSWTPLTSFPRPIEYPAFCMHTALLASAPFISNPKLVAPKPQQLLCISHSPHAGNLMNMHLAQLSQKEKPQLWNTHIANCTQPKLYLPMSFMEKGVISIFHPVHRSFLMRKAGRPDQYHKVTNITESRSTFEFSNNVFDLCI